MSHNLRIPVNPAILTWARTSIGRSITDLARRTNVNEEHVKNWENGSQSPTLNQLKTIAQYYRRPLAVFFMKNPPEEEIIIPDFRIIPDEERNIFQTETRIAFRKADRIRSIVQELDINHKLLLPQVTNMDDPEKLAIEMREKFQIDIKTQSKWKDEYTILKNWREIVERHGIYVMQMSFPIEDGRGFTIGSDSNPVIVINIKDSPNGRIFSLFHELCHVLLNVDGVSDYSSISKNEIPSDEVKRKEIFCNHFAGAFLVPKNDLLNNDIIKKKQNEWNDSTFKEIAKMFGVSKEVIIRRLLIVNAINEDIYQKYTNKWKNAKKTDSTGGAKHPAIDCVNTYGTTFITQIFQKYDSNQITLSDISDYLDIKAKYITEIRDHIEDRL